MNTKQEPTEQEIYAVKRYCEVKGIDPKSAKINFGGIIFEDIETVVDMDRDFFNELPMDDNQLFIEVLAHILKIDTWSDGALVPGNAITAIGATTDQLLLAYWQAGREG